MYPLKILNEKIGVPKQCQRVHHHFKSNYHHYIFNILIMILIVYKLNYLTDSYVSYLSYFKCCGLLVTLHPKRI